MSKKCPTLIGFCSCLGYLLLAPHYCLKPIIPARTSSLRTNPLSEEVSIIEFCKLIPLDLNSVQFFYIPKSRLRKLLRLKKPSFFPAKRNDFSIKSQKRLYMPEGSLDSQINGSDSRMFGECRDVPIPRVQQSHSSVSLWAQYCNITIVFPDMFGLLECAKHHVRNSTDDVVSEGDDWVGMMKSIGLKCTF